MKSVTSKVTRSQADNSCKMRSPSDCDADETEPGAPERMNGWAAGEMIQRPQDNGGVILLQIYSLDHS